MNYLTVTEWNKDASVKSTMPITLFKRTPSRGNKGRDVATAYEKELNGGKTFLEVAEEGQVAKYSVVNIPYHQAREFLNFAKWEDCSEYK